MKYQYKCINLIEPSSCNNILSIFLTSTQRVNYSCEFIAFTHNIFLEFYKFRCVSYELFSFVNYVTIKTWIGYTLLHVYKYM